MIETLHRAAQYLAATANSQLDSQSDDSQANLKWDTEYLALGTRPLNKAGNLILSLNYPDFKLEWLEPGERIIDEFPLQNKKHNEIMDWLSSSGEKIGLAKEINFNISYEFPYGEPTGFEFKQPTPEEFVVFGNHRSNAQKALEEVFEDQEEVSEIRVWPHHFDTGGLVLLDKDFGAGTSLGLGLAIPDGMIKDFYYYAAAYSNSELDYSELMGLRHGMWMTDSWKGIALPASNVTKEKAVIFFKEAILALQDLLESK